MYSNTNARQAAGGRGLSLKEPIPFARRVCGSQTPRTTTESDH
ncbi:hypothetical protein AFNJKBDN_CDS0002 [Halorubrum virus V_ICIS4]|nr:hypothetical protein AFNJKBDN_CDS0002 [Halorubrum virus V_ICIS4]